MALMLALLSQLAQIIGLTSVMNHFRNPLLMIKREGSAISGKTYMFVWPHSNLD